MNVRLFAASACLSLCALVPATVGAQALTSLSSVRVGYITRKNTVKPQGEIKSQVDALDAQIAEATRLGKSGELRRLFAKGIALLNGRPWNDAVEYANSLAIRTATVVADSSKPYAARIEQIFAPAIDLPRAVTAHVALRKRPVPVQGQPPQAGEVAKDLGTFDGVARDLRESPFPLELDVHDVADGTYVLTVDVADQGKPLGTTALTIALRNGLDDLVGRLEADAKRAPDALGIAWTDRMAGASVRRPRIRTRSERRISASRT